MTATISQVRDAIKTVLNANINDLRVYDTVPEVTNVPAVVVEPSGATFQGFNSLCSQWNYDLFVLVSRVDAGRGQDALDAYIDGAGVRSIRQVIFNNPTLGLTGVDATVEAMRSYGGTFESTGVKYIGAILRVTVLITV